MATPHRVLNRDRRTLEAIFRHPVSGNIAWSEASHLIDRLGTVRQESNGRLLLAIGEHRQVFHPPHAKALTPEEVAQVRRFLEGAGVTPASVEVVEEEHVAESTTFDMVVAIEHHQTRLFTITGAAEIARTLRPYDPHHFLHHLSHRQDRELRGQREPEEPSYYSQIAAALAPARRILLLGHGTGHSNAAAHLDEVLRARHPEIHSRIVATKVVDLSAITEPQLLALALAAFELPKNAST
ncbi:MAG: hypothetical protein WCA14_04450 [Steroidobacteraceae bacterium]